MKKLLVAMIAGLAGFAANAAYLYWQVESSDYSNITEPDRVNAYNVYAVESNGTQHFLDGYRGDAGSMNMSEAQTVDLGVYSGANYSYYVELMNYSNGTASKLGYSDSMSYADMVQKNYITDNLLSVSQVSVWHGVAVDHSTPGGGGGYNAPEPTSAMMILLGLAGLALKRKQV